MMASSGTDAAAAAAANIDDKMGKEDRDSNLVDTNIKMGLLEDKFATLAEKFRFSMNLYGLFEDVSLLLNPKSIGGGSASHAAGCCQGHSKGSYDNNNSTPHSTSGKWNWRAKWTHNFIKLISFSLVLLANFTAVYVMLAHFIWEYRMLDAKAAAPPDSAAQSSGQNQVQPEVRQQSAATSTAAAAVKHSSMLKDFLENLRRHLARFFSLGLIVTWHLSCHKIERLFVDCQRYYSIFYKWQHQFNENGNYDNDSDDDGVGNDDGDGDLDCGRREPDVDGELAVKIGSSSRRRRRKLQEARGEELLEASASFYKLARHRINVSLWLPVLHYLFNVMSVTIFASSSKRSHQPSRLPAPEAASTSGGGFLNSMFQQAMENFDSFHLAIHTAFHPYDHKLIKPGSSTQVRTIQQHNNATTLSLGGPNSTALAAAAAASATNANVSIRQSAIYCLIELFVYSIYFHGPRIICATCLSLVLHMHYQCLRAFNKKLMGYIKRPRGRPLTSSDVVSLMKQYDLIGMMHERIERTFKWSIVLWYTLMFVSCLMHIFSFTESTSAYVVSTSTSSPSTPQGPSFSFGSIPQGQPQDLAAEPDEDATQIEDGDYNELEEGREALAGSGSQSMRSKMKSEASYNGSSGSIETQQQQQQPSSSSSSSTSSSSSIAIMFIRLASVFFVCYSPCLIYSEAFKIESAGARVEQLVMRLVRRQNDPLAQFIEPTLFEPIYLSVGGYFNLTKKSMSSFLGAVVTFSVMFIGANNNNNNDQPPDIGHHNGVGSGIAAAAGPNFGEPTSAMGRPDNTLADDDDDNNDEDDLAAQDAEDQEEEEAAEEDEREDEEREQEDKLGRKNVEQASYDLANNEIDLDGQDEGKQQQQQQASRSFSSDRGHLKPMGTGERVSSALEDLAGDAPSSGQNEATSGADAHRAHQVQQHLSRRLGLILPPPPPSPPLIPPRQEPTQGYPSSSQQQQQQKARQRRKFKRLRMKQLMEQEQQQQLAGPANSNRTTAPPPPASRIQQASAGGPNPIQPDPPRLEPHYWGHVREHERLVELTSKLRVLNHQAAEVCDFELRPLVQPEVVVAAAANRAENHSSLPSPRKGKPAQRRWLWWWGAEDHQAHYSASEMPGDQFKVASASTGSGNKQVQVQGDGATELGVPRVPFVISWIDRVNGEATLEALREDFMDCERKRNYTFRIRAIGCNGLQSNEALVSISVEDVNEFSPEFEQLSYSVTHEQEPEEDEDERAFPSGAAANDDDDNDEDVDDDDDKENKSAEDRDKTSGHGDEADREDGKLLLVVQARDRDCSPQFGSICRYELLAEQQQQDSAAALGATGSGSGHNLQGLSIDSAGRIWMERGRGGGRSSSSRRPTKRPPVPQAKPNHLSTRRLGRPMGRRGAASAANEQQQQQQQQQQETLSSMDAGSQHQNHHQRVMRRRSFQVIAYDCGGKKSQRPASVQVNFNRLCRPALQDVDTQVAYKPGSGARSPFFRAQLDLCGFKCHRPNISIALRLEATSSKVPNQASSSFSEARGSGENLNFYGGGGDLYPEHGSSAFHCDRDSYTMVSKRRLCGAKGRTMELLPPLSAHTNWILPLVRQPQPVAGSGSSKGPASDGSDSGATSASAGLQQQQPQSDPSGIGEQFASAGHEQPQGAAPIVAVAEVQEEGGGNLGAYSTGSIYSKRALQFQLEEMATAAAANEADPASAGTSDLPQAATLLPIGGETGSRSDPGSGYPLKQRRTRVQRQRPRQQQHLNENRRRLAARSAQGQLDGSGDILQPLPSPQLPASHSADSQSIYHDQVYRFDGHTSAVQVPRTVYASHLINSHRATKRNQSSTSGQHLFGSRHTISFWMRHSQFRFVGPAADPTRQQQQQQNGANANMDDIASSRRELDELGRHFKEHLLCATLESSASPASTSNDHSTHPANLMTQHNSIKNYYSVFIRNCRLILLMRRKLVGPSGAQAAQGAEINLNSTSKNYLPAEWRWTLPANEACDNKWHLYTINVNFPTVELYIDGSQFEESYDNLVVVDDLLLRPIEMPPSSQTRAASSLSPGVTYEDDEGNKGEPAPIPLEGLSVGLGACWDAHHGTWYGHFRGSLSGLSVLVGDNDDSRSIECLGGCSEELVSMAASQQNGRLWQPILRDQEQQQQPVMSSDGPAIVASKMDNSLISYQESQSKILLQGHNFLDIEEALTQIAYVNHRQLPSIGKRNILIDTSVECSGMSQQQQQLQLQQSIPINIPIEPIRVEVNVLPSKTLPILSITGPKPNFSRTYGQLIEGVRLFSSINLRSKRLNLEQFIQRHAMNDTIFQVFSRAETQSNNSTVFNSSKSRQQEVAGANNFLQPAPEDADYIEDSMVAVAAAATSGSEQPNPNDDNYEQSSNNIYNRVQPVNLATTRRRIEACSVQVYPPLNGLHESLILPMDKLDLLKLYWRQSYEGLIVYGLDSVENYQRIIRSIIYRNQKPAFYLERVFKLLCSDLNGRLLSNEYLQTVTIIHNNIQVTTNTSDTKFASTSSEQRLSSKVLATLEDYPLTAPRPASLLGQPSEKIEFIGGLNEPIHVLNGGGSGGQLPLLNREQSSQLDRVALAFLVFVVSLIVLMLVITLTNLKEPSIMKEPTGGVNRATRGRNGKRGGRKKLNPTSKSCGDELGPDCIYVDERASGDDDDGDSEDANGEMEPDGEEEEDDYYYEDDGYGYGYGDAQEAKCDNEQCFNVYCKNLNITAAQQLKQKQQTRSLYSRSSHQTTDQEESLAWDDEEEEEEEDRYEMETTNIVMNPMLHPAAGASSSSGQHQAEFKTLITEQRPNWRGAITQRPNSHLSYWSSSGVQPVDDYEFEETPDDNWIESEGLLKTVEGHQHRPKRRQHQTPRQHHSCTATHDNEGEEEDLSSCCSASSSSPSSSSSTTSSSSSSDSDSDFDTDPELDGELVAPRPMCRHMQRHHQHHLHHHHHHQHIHHQHHHKDLRLAIDEEAEPEPEAEEVLWPGPIEGGQRHYEPQHGHHFHHRCLRRQPLQEPHVAEQEQADRVNFSNNFQQHHEVVVDLGESELRQRRKRQSSFSSDASHLDRPIKNESTSQNEQPGDNDDDWQASDDHLTAALTCASSSNRSSGGSSQNLTLRSSRRSSNGSGIDSLSLN